MAKNVIENRIDRLASLWNASSDPEVRLVRWLVSLDERRMVDVFPALENEEIGQTADGFLRLEAPFSCVEDSCPVRALGQQTSVSAELPRVCLATAGG